MSGTDVLERVAELGSQIRAGADAAEQTGNISREVFDALRSAGCFRLAVPAAYGGEEATFAEQVAVVEQVTRIDGSTGWVTMILGTGASVLAYFPKETYDALYADGPDVIGAGTLAPKGRAEAVDGGYRVNGRWPFASGSHFADWLVVHCVVGDGELRMMLLSREEVEILDTWHVAGLKGTGSNDLKVDDVFVPAARSAKLFGGNCAVDTTLFRVPALSQLSLNVAACALGIARGAVADAVELAKTKRPAFRPGQRVAEDHVARFEIGRADLLVDAASSVLDRHVTTLWQAATAGAELSPVERARTRGAAWQITRLSLEAVEQAYQLGGGTSVYESCSLQRRMRDIHAVTQHAAVSRDPAVWLGGLLTDEAVPEARL